MTDAANRAAQLLKEHRESIDRLDAILVYTLGERFKHTQAVGRLKAEHDLPPADPIREESQIARLTDLANEADLDPEFAKLGGDEIGGAHLLEGDLGMRVQIAPPGGHLIVEFGDSVDDRHSEILI